MTYEETTKIIKAFADRNYEKYGNHAYNAGYFEVLIAQLLKEVSEEKKNEILGQLSERVNVAN